MAIHLFEGAFRNSIADWSMLVLLSLAPVFRAGLVKGVESMISRCVKLTGEDSKQEQVVLLDVEGDTNEEDHAADSSELNEESAAELHKNTWDGVQSSLGLGCREMCARAALRLWLLHLHTPATFLILFCAVLPMMDTLQFAFAVCVLLGEVIYIALVLATVYQQPAFLFFDVAANIGVGQAGLAATFVLSPGTMLAGREVMTTSQCLHFTILRAVLLILDGCAIFAFLSGAISGNLYLPLAALYAIAGLSALWAALALSFGENEVVDSIHRARDGVQRRFRCSATWLEGAFRRSPYTSAVCWLFLTVTQAVGAVVILYICYLLNSGLDGFKLSGGHILVNNAALAVSCMFWFMWSALSVSLIILSVTLCAKWPAIFQDCVLVELFIFGLWLLIPGVCVVWCFNGGNIHAALCVVCGLLPVALLGVGSCLYFLSTKSATRARQAAQV